MSESALARAARVFEQALREAPERRAAFVERTCGDDHGLAEEVRSLLRHHDSAEAFLVEPATLPADERGLERELTLPTTLGRYRLLERLGAGGMGVVYLAEQQNPRRRVALKVLRPGLATPELLARFADEAQVLGRLSHPGIAQIHEAATAQTSAGPQPWFAMELVEGAPLTEHARAQSLDLRERVELLIEVCDAVQHAHQQGVVHRDLKPGNILVDGAGRAKILDFGVARAVDGDLQHTTRHTRVGEIIGTLAYMSPEQAAGDPTQLDTRSDVYALGVVAYELLSDRLPFELEDTGLVEAVRVIREDDPPPLGSLRRELRGDFSTIIAKALEKDRGRRYGSTVALAEDLRRALDDEPIVARPPSTTYQLRKFARRNRVLVTAVATVFVLLVVATAVTSGLAVNLTEQRNLAVHAQESERVQRTAAQQAAQEAEASRVEAQRQADLTGAINTFWGDVLSQAEPGEGGKEASVADALASASARVDERFADRPAYAAAVHAKLAVILKERGDPRAAAAEGRLAYEILRDLPDADAWALANSALLAGSAWTTAGELDLALEALTRALDVLAEGGLMDDPLVGTALNDLGAALYFQERYAEAEPIQRQALAIRRELHGPEHAWTLMSLNNLANLMVKTARQAEAEPMLAEILAAWRKLGVPSHPNAITAGFNYADVLRELGRHEEAEEYFLVAIERGRAHLPARSWLQGLFASRYAELLIAMQRTDEAEPLLLESHELLSAVLGEEHDRTRRCLRSLVELYELKQDPGTAARWSRRLAPSEPE